MQGYDTFENSLKEAAKKIAQDARNIRYKNDPVLWAEEVLGVVLWSKQKEILTSLALNKRTAVKSCHSIGKTFISSVASAWWISTRENSMVQSTAPTYQQVHGQMWEEIRSLHTKYNLRGRVTLGDQWLVPYIVDGRQKDRLVGEGKKPADSNIHGFHGTHRPDGVLAILDEACGVASSIFTGSEAITTSVLDHIAAFGNPDDPNTPFGDIFAKGEGGEWHLITVSAYDTPHFTGEAEEMIKWAKKQDKDPKLVAKANARDHTETRTPYLDKVNGILEHMPDPAWIESRARDWGRESPRFLSKVMAQFPLTSADSLFSPMEIETGRNNVVEPEGSSFRVMAVDVARYGTDRTVVVLNVGGHIEVLMAMNSMDTMEVAATVHKLAMDNHADQVRVDGIGVGGGVVDRLVALSTGVGSPYVVVEMTASTAAPDRALHRNARAYWYDSLKYQLRNGLIDIPTSTPILDNEDNVVKAVPEGNGFEYAKALLKELSMIKYAYPNGIMIVESKEDIRRRGEHSPDFVDAVVMATAPISYITNDPMADKRPGQMYEIDVLDSIDIISPF